MFFRTLSIVNIPLYAGFLVLSSSFLFIPSLYNPYEFPKFLFYIIGACGLICIAFFCRYASSLYNLFSLLVIVYICVVLLANFLGVDPTTSFWGSPFRHQGYVLLLANVGLFFAISLQSVKDKEEAYIFFQKGVLVSSFLLCVFALWQAFFAFVYHDASIPLYQGRIVGTFGNPNSFGGYLAMLLPFLFSIRGNHSIYRICLIVLVMGVILLTGSRAALVASVFVFGVYGIFRSKIFVALAFFTLLFLGGLLFVRQSPWDNRFIIWQGAWEAFVQRPILGYGQENFSLAFTKVKFYPLDNAHNIFLETAIASGIIGLILFCLIFIKALTHATLPIKMSLAVFLIVAQFNPLSIPQITLFWLLLGFKDTKG